MADRIELPNTTFMRRSAASTWHLGPHWSSAYRYVEARCGMEGPWLVFIASLPPDAEICDDCLAQAGVTLSGGAGTTAPGNAALAPDPPSLVAALETTRGRMQP